MKDNNSLNQIFQNSFQITYDTNVDKFVYLISDFRSMVQVALQISLATETAGFILIKLIKIYISLNFVFRKSVSVWSAFLSSPSNHTIP